MRSGWSRDTHARALHEIAPVLTLRVHRLKLVAVFEPLSRANPAGKLNSMQWIFSRM